jgi:diguanylate cyclase (GGDEF)-like protein
MENSEGGYSERAAGGSGRVLNRDLFLFLLDLEVKRARRYQNFLCLVLLKIRPFLKEDDAGGIETCHDILRNLLAEEVRESDIIGSLETDKMVVLLPYADVKAAIHLKSRFEDALKYYDFKEKGVEVTIDQICFPVNGANTMDLIKKASAKELF